RPGTPPRAGSLPRTTPGSPRLASRASGWRNWTARGPAGYHRPVPSPTTTRPPWKQRHPPWACRGAQPVRYRSSALPMARSSGQELLQFGEECPLGPGAHDRLLQLTILVHVDGGNRHYARSGEGGGVGLDVEFGHLDPPGVLIRHLG